MRPWLLGVSGNGAGKCDSVIAQVAQLADGELLWQLTVEHSPVGTTLVAPDGRLLSANRALCDMLGYSEEQIRELTFQQITHPDDLAGDLALVAETLAGLRSSYRLRKRYLHADGHVVIGDLSVALLRSPDGQPIHFISQILDVTAATEHAEQLAATSLALDRQRRYLEAVVDSVDIGVAVFDSVDGYVVVNHRLQQYNRLAHPDDDCGGRAGEPGELFAEDGRRLEAHELPSSRASAGEEFDDLMIWVGSDPLTQRALQVSAHPIRGAAGEFSGAVLAYSDVTDYARALDAKDHFVAAVSHELRTPLTSVIGHLELLAGAQDLPVSLARRVEVIERNATRLQELVGDLLQSQQMSAGRLTITRLPVDLSALLADAVEAVRPLARTSYLDLSLDMPDTGVVARVDALRLRQVVDNLLTNAVKYTEPGGRVSVRLWQLGSTVDISVADTGIGAAPDEVDRLFRPFFRGAGATQRQVPGAGLGLSIVHGIVEAHGGQIHVDTTLGSGSTFHVELPWRA